MRHASLSSLVIIFSIAGWLIPPVHGQLPTIELSSLSRSAGQRDSTFELQARGNRLDELSSITCSDARVTAAPQFGATRLLADQPSPTGSFKVSIPPSVERGLVEMRAVGRFGISNPRRLLVTAKPVQVVTTDHTTWNTPLPLPSDTIIQDQCRSEQRNYLQTHLVAGETLSCVAYAEQIDSKANLCMFLVDENGHELARSRAMGAWPAEIHYLTKEAGEFYLIVHDLLYAGGQDYAYLLEAVTHSNPTTPTALELDASLRPTLMTGVDGGVEAASIEQDEGDESETKQPILSVIGSFSQVTRHYDFSAQAGQQLAIEVESADVGQLTDPQLVLYKMDQADGQEARLSQIHVQDDPGNLGNAGMRILRKDPTFIWKMPEDATYRIVLDDNQAGKRPADSVNYKLSVSDARPSFALLAYRPFPSNNPATSRPMGSNLMRGGTESIRVLAIRKHGFDASIEISLKALPPGIVCAPSIIPKGATEAELILHCAEDAADWHGSLQVIGRDIESENTLQATAEYATCVWPAAPTRNAVQTRRSANLACAINAFDLAPLLVELGDGSLIEAPQGGKVTVPIKVIRRPGGQAECLLRPRDLPPGVTLGEIKIPADKSEASAELSIAADARLGEGTFWMQNETKVRYRPNPQALEREEAYVAKLKSALAAADEEDQKQKLTTAIAESSARVEELKKQSAEQEIAVWLATTPQRIRVTPVSN